VLYACEKRHASKLCVFSPCAHATYIDAFASLGGFSPAQQGANEGRWLHEAQPSTTATALMPSPVSLASLATLCSHKTNDWRFEAMLKGCTLPHAPPQTISSIFGASVVAADLHVSCSASASRLCRRKACRKKSNGCSRCLQRSSRANRLCWASCRTKGQSQQCWNWRFCMQHRLRRRWVKACACSSTLATSSSQSSSSFCQPTASLAVVTCCISP
jgi:hypothetical protein